MLADSENQFTLTRAALSACRLCKREFLPLLSLLLLLVAGRSAQADTLTFDGVSAGQGSVAMPSGYGGLNWNNFGVICGSCQSVSYGYHAGVVSPANVAFNLQGNPASISVNNTTVGASNSIGPGNNLFDLNSAYLTAALNLDTTMQVRVQGFAGTHRLYDATYVINRRTPTLANFNFAGVDRVTFTPTPNIQFAMDDLAVSFPGACSYSLTPGGREHGSGSETGSISVATQSNCAWIVNNTNSWVTILSAPTNSGPGTLTYAVADNPSALRRTGVIEVSGQLFSLTQGGIPSPPVAIGPIEVSTLGQSSSSLSPGSNSTINTVFLIDQDQSSGGGAVLPSLSVNWDTNTQFKVSVTAPAGNKFSVHVPAGGQVGFGGYLWWQTAGGGGTSPTGPVAAEFEGLEGVPPAFSQSDATLSSTHGYFGFLDLEGTTVSGDFAFTSVTLTGTVLPQYTGHGSEDYTPHANSSLYLYCRGSTSNFVSMVPDRPQPSVRVQAVSSNAVTLVLQGGRPRLHVVECSEDFIHWIPISTNAMPGTVIDAGCSNSTRRFYRTYEAP